ncbi:MAG: hypothetical protein HY741_20820 [Chloroflexi bacterium]|nr:hypothetical protein [Chloroflexota bacterium]
MNKKNALFFLLLLVTGILVWILMSTNDEIARAGRPMPTAAPTKTPGPPASVKSTQPELAHPLTKEESLQMAFDYDRQLAVWEKPWDMETAHQEKGRISIEWHKDQTYDGSTLGRYSERGPIWVISITGKVRLKEDRSGKFHDGITYRISERTGNLISFSAGEWIE